jgi:hypothetical protein
MNLKKLGPLSVFAVLITFALTTSALGQRGFDQFGYNNQANIFVGSADGVDRVLDGMLYDDSTYANDLLIMKWSKAWADAKYRGAPWTCAAWIDNEWNGMTPNGSGETWHYKIVYVGPAGEASPCWRDGGYTIWGDFEVIFSHGTVANQHFWDAHAIPAGFGSY